MNNKLSLSYKISLLALTLSLIVVLLGAYTRLVDAGLGCPDWPGCYGFISVPVTTADVQTAQEAFPHAPVEADKAWAEMIHRYFAGTLGLLILSLSVMALLNRKDEAQPVFLPLLLLGVVCFQAALGMWTVTLGLLPIVVMGHLLGGFASISLLLLLFLRLRQNIVKPAYNPLKMLTAAGLLIVVLQVTLGGWTSANYAAIICTDFPTCQGAMVPQLDFSGAFQIRTEGVTNYLGGHLGNDERVTIHWMHRLGALITTLFVSFLTFRLFVNGLKAQAAWLGGVLLIQVSLGISNVVFSLPLAVAVAHNGVAAVLLLTLVALLNSAYPSALNKPEAA